MNYHKNEIEELAASYDEYIDEYEELSSRNSRI